MQPVDLDSKIELEIVGRFLPNLLDTFLERNPDIQLIYKKIIGKEELSIYCISFEKKSSLKVKGVLTRAEDSLGYCAEVYFNVIKGDFPQDPIGPFKPVGKKAA